MKALPFPAGGESTEEVVGRVCGQVVDDYEAIRVLALRVERREQSDVVRFLVEQAAGSSWRVESRCSDRPHLCEHRALSSGEGRIVTSRGSHESTVEVALEIMSDVGALEVAGHSIADPARPSWESDDPMRMTAATVPLCLRGIRNRLARALQDRIRDNAERLRRDAFDFSSPGWDTVDRFVWPDGPVKRVPGKFPPVIDVCGILGDDAQEEE